MRSRMRLIASVRHPLDEPVPIGGTVAWYVAAAIVVIALLIAMLWG